MAILSNADIDELALTTALGVAACAELRWEVHPGLSLEEMHCPTCDHEGCRLGSAYLKNVAGRYGDRLDVLLRVFLKDKAAEEAMA